MNNGVFVSSVIKPLTRRAAQPHLNANQVKGMRVICPPLALQQQFAEKIQAIEAQKELVKQSIAETQQLLDSRMDYYFN
jgi:type I restriction enzyme S subunit